jgi:hypothetical protein
MRSKAFLGTGAVYLASRTSGAALWAVDQGPSHCIEVAPHRAARSKASSVIALVSTVGRIAGGAPGP